MAFITINEAFICEVCGTENCPAQKTCRNHCKKCLSSKHVDEKFPGDRESQCLGTMKAIDIQVHPKHELVIIHECEKCGKKIKNKKADDDSQETILEIQKRKAESFFR